jgi:hypothetical protein
MSHICAVYTFEHAVVLHGNLTCMSVTDLQRIQFITFVHNWGMHIVTSRYLQLEQQLQQQL